MPETSDLSELVSGKSEDLAVEYKAWVDTTDSVTRAKLAKHIAALANHGGGYLVFGVDDATRQPLGETTLDRRMFDQDAMAGIVRKYLDPRPAVRVELARHGGVNYPVVIVPGHQARPVLAIADGPQVGGNPIGVRQGDVYVRAAGPESVRIRNADDWTALLERCLGYRADLVSKIVRQSIARPDAPSAQAKTMLQAAMGATSEDFVAQTRELAEVVRPDDRPLVNLGSTGFCVLGYALVGEDGEPLELEGLRSLAERISVAMHEHAYNGWASFLTLNFPGRGPQMRTASLLGEERNYLEGMRLAKTAAFVGGFDYWRIYEEGMGVFAEAYWEDAMLARKGGGGPPYLSVLHVTWRLHSLLAHARLVGQEVDVAQVLVRTEWRGLTGRTLKWGPHDLYEAAGTIATDQYSKVTALPWRDLRDSYFACLRRLAMPIFDLFPHARPPEQWFTRELVETEFKKFSHAGAKLFED